MKLHLEHDRNTYKVCKIAAAHTAPGKPRAAVCHVTRLELSVSRDSAVACRAAAAAQRHAPLELLYVPEAHGVQTKAPAEEEEEGAGPSACVT